MADLQLIQGEKFARTGGLKAGELDNVGAQIGKGLETVGKEVQEAMVKVSSWGEAEEAFNNDMQKVETDGLSSGNDLNFSEQDAASEYLTGLKKKYGDAAAKASKIENKGSAAYKNQVKIMNEVNAAAKNFATQKDTLLASRKEYQANPGGLSISNSFDTSSASQMNLLGNKGQWSVDEKGNIIVDGQKMSDMGALKQKSKLNALTEEVYSNTYEASLKEGVPLTETQVEKAGQNIVTSLINSGDPRSNVASFAFDPLTGTQTLYSKDSEEGKALAENLKNWGSLTNEQKNEIYNQVGEKHKNLLRAQSQKGVEDYKAANPTETSDTVKETFYSSDKSLDLLNKEGGAKIVKVGNQLYTLSSDGKRVGVAIAAPDGKTFSMDTNQSTNLMDAEGNFDYEAFAALTGGRQGTRTVQAAASQEKSSAITDTQNTAVTEANLGGETRNIPGTETGDATSDTPNLSDVSDPVSEDTKKSNEDNLSELKELEEKVAKLKESLKEGGYEKKKERDSIDGKSLDSNTDRGFFTPGFGERREDISTSKTGPDATKNDPSLSGLVEEDMIANQIKQDKKDLDARKLNPGDFPSESERSIMEVNQEQEDELKIKGEVVNAAPGTDTKKVKDQENKFVDLKGSLSFPLVGGRGNSKLFRKQGEVNHESIPGIKVKSNGLQFDVKEGSQAAAVGKGKVVAITKSDDGTKTVMVEHEGGYISVYGPLGTLGVKTGDEINKNTSLGKVHTKKAGKGPKTLLKFQIWKNNKAVNPEEWLA